MELGADLHVCNAVWALQQGVLYVGATPSARPARASSYAASRSLSPDVSTATGASIKSTLNVPSDYYPELLSKDRTYTCSSSFCLLLQGLLQSCSRGGAGESGGHVL